MCVYLRSSIAPNCQINFSDLPKLNRSYSGGPEPKIPKMGWVDMVIETS